MGEPLPPEDRPDLPGDSDKPWNKKDFRDFLRAQDPDQEDAPMDSPLDRLDEKTQEIVINNFELYSALDDEIKERVEIAVHQLHAEKLTLLRSLVQTTAQLSEEVLDNATKFAHDQIHGEELARKFEEVATVCQFLHRQVMKLTASDEGSKA